jgi:PAS domain S-box-containing protein
MSDAARPSWLDAPARRFFEAAPFGIAVCDGSLAIGYANALLAATFGYDCDQLARLGLLDLVHPEDAASLERGARALSAGRPTQRAEQRFVRRDGRVVWCQVAFSHVGPGERLVMIEDVSERRAAEQKIREGERLVAVGTLAAGIAHEINNPVGSILASAQYALMVAEDDDGPAKVEEALRNIVSEARRCGQIVKSVLKFAREETTERWPADLNQVVGQARDHSMELTRRYGARLELELADHLPEIPLNPTEVEQLLANLIRNALQSGGYGITVTVRTEDQGDHVVLSVADDGPGMPPEVREQVFDPFFTTRESSGGTGLGLSMVHGIVSGHGGKISVHSEPGRGTEVTIQLPVQRAGGAGADAGREG